MISVLPSGEIREVSPDIVAMVAGHDKPPPPVPDEEQAWRFRNSLRVNEILTHGGTTGNMLSVH